MDDFRLSYVSALFFSSQASLAGPSPQLLALAPQTPLHKTDLLNILGLLRLSSNGLLLPAPLAVVFSDPSLFFLPIEMDFATSALLPPDFFH